MKIDLSFIQGFMLSTFLISIGILIATGGSGNWGAWVLGAVPSAVLGLVILIAKSFDE